MTVLVTSLAGASSGVQIAYDAAGNAQGIAGLRLNTANPYAFMPDGQPFGITKPVLEAGKQFTNNTGGNVFNDASKWVAISGVTGDFSNVSAYDASGNITGTVVSRTGQPNLLKVTPSLATQQIGIPSTNMTPIAAAGKFGLWVYVDLQPGYQVGGSLSGNLALGVSTGTGYPSDELSFNWNTNQLREGWNFLKAVVTKDMASNTDVDTHFLGITQSCYDYTKANVFTGNTNKIVLTFTNLVGVNLYFDSLWTGWNHKPQIVLGCDASGADLTTIAKPIFDANGWVGYTAVPRRVSNPSFSTVADWMLVPADSSNLSRAKTVYDAGWDCVNHTTNHNRMGDYTAADNIRSELVAVNAWYAARGMTRGLEFYASPQSSSSRMSELVIKNLGYKLQRHARKPNTSVTTFGLDNPQHIGAIDMGSRASWQAASKIKAHIDMLIRYGDTGFLFWHVITTLGDPATGEGISSDDLTIYYSNFVAVMAYIRAKEQAGALTVCKGVTGFYYGI